MNTLWLAAWIWVVSHLALAGTRLRDGLVAAMGERLYQVLYSLIAVAALAFLIHAYNHVGASRVLWQAGRGIRDCGIVVVGLAFLLGIEGLVTANPTAVGQQKIAMRMGAVTGILHITRHPFLWGVALWAAFHIAANGDAASVVFFGSFLVLAVLGTFSIDAKRQRQMGAAYAPFTQQTSNLPLVALLTGRTRLRLRDVFGWRFWLAMAVFVAMLFAHLWVFGVSPFPGGWQPY